MIRNKGFTIHIYYFIHKTMFSTCTSCPKLPRYLKVILFTDVTNIELYTSTLEEHFYNVQ